MDIFSLKNSILIDNFDNPRIFYMYQYSLYSQMLMIRNLVYFYMMSLTLYSFILFYRGWRQFVDWYLEPNYQLKNFKLSKSMSLNLIVFLKFIYHSMMKYPEFRPFDKKVWIMLYSYLD